MRGSICWRNSVAGEGRWRMERECASLLGEEALEATDASDMAQGVQAEHQPFPDRASLNACNDEGFAASIIEIGFIDEDEVGSDNSQTSVSEEEKVEPCSDPLSKTPESLDAETTVHDQPIEDCNEIISFNHVPSEEVPTHQQVVSITHSSPTDANEEHNESQEESKSSVDGEAFEESLLIVQSNAETELDRPRTLDEAMARLQASLDDRSALSIFEKLSKKRTNACMDIAKLPENVSKNRYKDVLPYDESRVILSGTLEESYINASFVRMELPPPRTAHEYIATQGPLPNTCDEFWQMVFEQKCGIIVMVTTLRERNRVKCHQYWPDLYQEAGYGHFRVTCFNETASAEGSVTREFLLSNDQTSEERHVIQLQYITWPDHGVPEDSTDFLQFVQQLRDLRRLVGGPVIVHCSAGVGRTGVVILMETAIDFIEAAEPFDPMQLVKIMRDQRVMMVQTVIQYRFICEAILRTYKDHRVEITDEDE